MAFEAPREARGLSFIHFFVKARGVCVWKTRQRGEKRMYLPQPKDLREMKVLPVIPG